MARVRGVRGAAGVCALAAVLYLLARSVLTLLVSGIMGLMQPGASLAHAAGFGEVGVILLQTLVGIGALALPLWWLLCSTRLQVKDMRITIPTAWSPGFCLPVFLGLANAGNLLGGLLCRIFGVEQPGTLLAGGGAELFLQFVSLCRGFCAPAAARRRFSARRCCSGCCIWIWRRGLRHLSALCFWAGWQSAQEVFCRECSCILSTIRWHF